MAHRKEIVIPQRSPRRIGVVPSDRRDKTRKVTINFTARHPKYGKYVRRRTVLYEIVGVEETIAKQALARIAHKMPVRCRFVGRRLAV